MAFFSMNANIQIEMNIPSYINNISFVFIFKLNMNLLTSLVKTPTILGNNFQFP